MLITCTRVIQMNVKMCQHPTVYTYAQKNPGFTFLTIYDSKIWNQPFSVHVNYLQCAPSIHEVKYTLSPLFPWTPSSGCLEDHCIYTSCPMLVTISMLLFTFIVNPCQTWICHAWYRLVKYPNICQMEQRWFAVTRFEYLPPTIIPMIILEYVQLSAISK